MDLRPPVGASLVGALAVAPVWGLIDPPWPSMDRPGLAHAHLGSCIPPRPWTTPRQKKETTPFQGRITESKCTAGLEDAHGGVGAFARLPQGPIAPYLIGDGPRASADLHNTHVISRFDSPPPYRLEFANTQNHESYAGVSRQDPGQHSGASETSFR